MYDYLTSGDNPVQHFEKQKFFRFYFGDLENFREKSKKSRKSRKFLPSRCKAEIFRGSSQLKFQEFARSGITGEGVQNRSDTPGFIQAECKKFREKNCHERKIQFLSPRFLLPDKVLPRKFIPFWYSWRRVFVTKNISFGIRDKRYFFPLA